MNIKEFVQKFHNHPVLFVGAGLSLRYLENAYTWNKLLQKIIVELTGNVEDYLDLKAKSSIGNNCYDYSALAEKIEIFFDSELANDRNGKFKEINDIYYTEMGNENQLSRMKVYICKLLSALEFKSNVEVEIKELKKARKNVGAVITTNYDNLIEHIFEFSPLVGNDILLSNPYGSVYKIHGCVTDPKKIIITSSDYKDFNHKHDLIRAQLLSIFIHNPIIFIGYRIGDENIKNLLKTIFTYVEPNSEEAEKIRSNFLLVEYNHAMSSIEIMEHDIDIDEGNLIRINKIKTNDFIPIYKSIAELTLPITAMDIRKVQNVVKDIYSGVKDDGTSIHVSIADDIDSLKNSDKILVIGSSKNISYISKNSTSFIVEYFSIIEESNHQLVAILDEIKIPTSQWFPAFGFSVIKKDLKCIEKLKKQQINKIETNLQINLQVSITKTGKPSMNIDDILMDEKVSESKKCLKIMQSAIEGKLCLKSLKSYLLHFPDKKQTDFRRLLCVYDYMLGMAEYTAV